MPRGVGAWVAWALAAMGAITLASCGDKSQSGGAAGESSGGTTSSGGIGGNSIDGGAGTGACACVLPHATAICVDGGCEVQNCDPGWGECDGLAATGCEVDLSDSKNCGGCGHVCSVGCLNGQCNCPIGYADCDSLPE